MLLNSKIRERDISTRFQRFSLKMRRTRIKRKFVNLTTFILVSIVPFESQVLLFTKSDTTGSFNRTIGKNDDRTFF